MGKMIYILNGPNLNMLGTRQPELYGTETLDDVEKKCSELARAQGAEIRLLQSNAEHELVGWIQEARGAAQGIVINAAAYSHSSIAILDALNMFDGKVIEVHLTNIGKRETFRHHSFVTARADAVIMGCGTHGYELAVQHILRG